MKKFLLGLICGITVTASTAVYASDTIQAYLFPVRYQINGEIKGMEKDYSTLNYNGHVYVPIRFITENLGAFVDYNDRNTEIKVNYFPAGMDLLTDNKYPNIHFGIIDLYLDGGYTGIWGLLSLNDMKESVKKEYTINFKLNFYDKNNDLIGSALGSSKSGSSAEKQTISNGEIKYAAAGEVGDFSKYNNVKFEIIDFEEQK
ncbi:copper amine oxidase N-terminal domain-containing protein [Paenibacillus alginolyticus]|uniref:stalk domain-containing protein n=1 Tax=Paenibacillus alginolyticus TaxID=59839 RepID=UPI001376A627|nr:stalk domain-containing protein [Paenibacillus alginolyticus]MCY9667665.1 copper amine oxidase N-terminal domain-containing protein [Paenibacillus alginolyticus]